MSVFPGDEAGMVEQQVAFDQHPPMQAERFAAALPKPCAQAYRPVPGGGRKALQFGQEAIGPGKAGGGEVQQMDPA
ncbi:hypothetical protein GCM10027294_23640 [Marinactinospora endophytica]